jgi:rhamnosyltransferase
MNAARDWPAFYEGLKLQTLPLKEILILDSMSADGTPELAAAAGYTVLPIARSEFNHGGTRQVAIDRLNDVEIVIFLTQDAALTDPDALLALVAAFDDPTVGATYGRQLPRAQADPIEAHGRLFNYPETSAVKSWEDRHRLGIKAAFLSNSCSAYRRSAILAVGGFPLNTLMAEDTLVAAKMLMAGWKTVYAADARVIHSHGYSIGEEFSRYFDTGVYHEREAWLLENFGSASGEGKRFVISELRYLMAHAPYLIPIALVRTATKWLAYQLGRNEAKLSPALRRRLSKHKHYWDAA